MKPKNLFTLLLLVLSTSVMAQLNPMKAMKAEQEAAKAAQEAAEKERAEMLAVYFSGRSETASADVATDKQNIPVKKESFEGLLARYKENGFKIAVQLTTGAVYTKAPPSDASRTGVSQDDRQFVLTGSLPSMQKELAPLASAFAEKMNETFDTDLFVAVDMKTIPYKTTKFGKKDKWEDTKYKMVVTYRVNLDYDYRKESKEYKADFNAHIVVNGSDYQYDKKKGVKIKSVFNNNIGNYKVGKEQEDAFGVKTIQELDAIINPPKGDDLVQVLAEAEEAKFDKFIAKLKK